MRRQLFVNIPPLLIIAVCGYLLFEDFRSESGGAKTSEGPVLASVSGVSGDVKRKPDRRMIWFNVENRQDLHKRDTIRTAKGSTTQIRMANGNSITVGESSLIVLEQSGDRLAVDFVSGSLFSKGGGTGIVLRSKGVSINAGSAQLELSSTKDGAASIAVKGGNVTVESNGKSVTIAENQKGDLTEKGVGEVTEIPVRLQAPVADALFVFEEGKTSLDFNWEVVKKLKNPVLEVATDREFESLVKSIKVDGRLAVTNVGLTDGTYYWRIAAAGQAVSDTRIFDVRQKAPIKLLDPAPEKVVRFGKVPPHLVFHWIGPAYYDHYELQLASDPAFTKPLPGASVDGANQAVLDLDYSGSVYWRVAGSSARLPEKELTSARALALKKLDHPEPPEPLSPAPGAAIALGGDGARTELRWTPTEEASGYLVEIASDEKFTDIVETSRTSQTSFVWQTKKPGRVFWRVSAFDIDQQPVPAKGFRDLLAISSAPLRLSAPEDRFKAQYLDEKPKIELSWETEPAAGAYEIELARDSGFAQGVTRLKADHPQAVVPPDLPDGTYFWRVRALDTRANPFRTSQVRSFELKGKDLLPSPELRAPAADFAFFGLQPEEIEVAFAWGAVEGAQEYELVVRPDASAGSGAGGAADKDTVRRFKTTQGKLLGLAAGSYTWGIRTIDSAGRPGKLGRLSGFRVRQEDVLPPPQDIVSEVIQTRR